MRLLGIVLYTIAVIGIFAVDIASSWWLATEHGIGWVILAWVTFAPLFIIPFLAGYGLVFVVLMGMAFVGNAMTE